VAARLTATRAGARRVPGGSLVPRSMGLGIAVTCALAALTSLAGCSPIARTPTYPPAEATQAAAGATTAAAQAEVARALASYGLQAPAAQTSYRPPEGARFAAAPRTVIQVPMANDQAHNYVVLYAFASPADALAAANDQATYVSRGSGHVYFAPDTQFTIRVVGSVAIFYAWSPANAPDPASGDIASALQQVGIGVDVPS
jgi:hypothetical protein